MWKVPMMVDGTCALKWTQTQVLHLKGMFGVEQVQNDTVIYILRLSKLPRFCKIKVLCKRSQHLFFNFNWIGVTKHILREVRCMNKLLSVKGQGKESLINFYFSLSKSARTSHWMYTGEYIPTSGQGARIKAVLGSASTQCFLLPNDTDDMKVGESLWVLFTYVFDPFKSSFQLPSLCRRVCKSQTSENKHKVAIFPTNMRRPKCSKFF